MLDEDAVLSYEPFAGDDTDVTVFKDKMVTARKAAKCTICFGPIEVGQRVRARTECNNEEHKLMTFRFCPECCEAMAHASEDALRAITARTTLGMDRAAAERCAPAEGDPNV